jgi:hypothetical protein
LDNINTEIKKTELSNVGYIHLTLDGGRKINTAIFLVPVYVQAGTLG